MQAFVSAALAIACAGATASAALDFSSNSTLIGAPLESISGVVSSFDADGNITGTQAWNDGGALGNLDGVALIGTEVFLAGTSGSVGRLDQTTGNVVDVFTTTAGAIEGLGEFDGTLIVADFFGLVGGRALTYDVDGNLLNTVEFVTGGITGVDFDGTNYYLADFTNNQLVITDDTGATTSSFSIPNGSSGLAFAGDSVWVSFGFGDNTVRQYALDGTQLDVFTFEVNGLALIPAPGICAIFAMGGLGAIRRRR